MLCPQRTQATLGNGWQGNELITVLQLLSNSTEQAQTAAAVTGPRHDMRRPWLKQLQNTHLQLMEKEQPHQVHHQE